MVSITDMESRETIGKYPEWNPFGWREGRSIYPLETFDYPKAKIRSEFKPVLIHGLTAHRMSGWRFKMTAQQVRDALRREELTHDELTYFCEVFNQFDGIDFKLFLYGCGASIYELARTMIACSVRKAFVKEFINRLSSSYVRAPNIFPPYLFLNNLYRRYGIKESWK